MISDFTAKWILQDKVNVIHWLSEMVNDFSMVLVFIHLLQVYSLQLLSKNLPLAVPLILEGWHSQGATQLTLGERRVTWKGRSRTAGSTCRDSNKNTLTPTGNLQCPVHPTAMCMSLDRGRKLEKSYADIDRTCKLHRERSCPAIRFKPRTILAVRQQFYHCTTFPSFIKLSNILYNIWLTNTKPSCNYNFLFSIEILYSDVAECRVCRYSYAEDLFRIQLDINNVVVYIEDMWFILIIERQMVNDSIWWATTCEYDEGAFIPCLDGGFRGFS